MTAADVSDADPPNRMLANLRVLDFTQYLAGPVCTRMLAEMGAEVIKVELPPYGDPQRGSSPRAKKRSGGFLQQNRGKRSFCVDFATDEGRGLIEAIVPHVDVVVENFSPGVMARRGLDYESLDRIHPGIIMASITGFGQTGKLAAKPAFDSVIQAFSGLMHMTGEPDGPPLLAGLPIADTSAGVHAFAAIGYALFSRTLTGRGCHIDIALLDSVFHLHEIPVFAGSMDPDYVATRTGQHYATQAPAGAFRGPDGWIVIFCTQEQIARLWQAMDRPDLATDERFASPGGRIAHRQLLTDEIEQWMNSFPSDHSVLERLELHRVPSSPVIDPARAKDDAHYRERGLVSTVNDPLIGEIDVPGFPLRFSNWPTGVPFETRTVGQDNEYVLRTLLGMDPDRVAALERSGVIASRTS